MKIDDIVKVVKWHNIEVNEDDANIPIVTKGIVIYKGQYPYSNGRGYLLEVKWIDGPKVGDKHNVYECEVAPTTLTRMKRKQVS